LVAVVLSPAAHLVTVHALEIITPLVVGTVRSNSATMAALAVVQVTLVQTLAALACQAKETMVAVM
jgi:hypothetical protein